MSAYEKDDWAKPRSQGQHFTKAEIAKIRAAFDAGRRADDIAFEMECSTRNVSKYYAKFRGVPAKRGRPFVKPKMVLASTPKPPQKSRFYTSNFEL